MALVPDMSPPIASWLVELKSCKASWLVEIKSCETGRNAAAIAADTDENDPARKGGRGLALAASDATVENAATSGEAANGPKFAVRCPRLRV